MTEQPAAGERFIATSGHSSWQRDNAAVLRERLGERQPSDEALRPFPGGFGRGSVDAAYIVRIGARQILGVFVHPGCSHVRDAINEVTGRWAGSWGKEVGDGTDRG